MTRNHRRTPRVYGAYRSSGCTDTRLVRAGVEPAGPEHGAPVLVREGEGKREGKNGDKRGNAAGAGDSGGAGGAGWTGIAAAAGAGALVVAAGGFLLVRRRGSRGRLG
ncbi:hypothetical protein [Streptomyces parvus]|uniref:hypothetical protein n=1 Tax=Streptomyces parvus TaxID=66428 RepID=UPI0021012AAF|nr:hypothetical protein [Streptomyces parvus]MCQ1577000.1 hypothetical protein [Streptomyces parvus]